MGGGIKKEGTHVSVSSGQSLSRVWLFVTLWTAVHQVSLSFTNSQSLLKLMSIELGMPSNMSSSVVPFSSCLQSFPASGYTYVYLYICKHVYTRPDSCWCMAPQYCKAIILQFFILFLIYFY